MTLVRKEISESTTNKNFIPLYDTTGVYDTVTNPTGYGAPNPDNLAATAATIEITKPNETSPTSINVYNAPYNFIDPNLTLYITPAIYSGSIVGTSISAASNATPIEITTSTAHGLSDNDNIAIVNVTGNLAANGYWSVKVTSATTFTLVGSVGSGAYAGGGYAVYQGSAQDFVDGVYLFKTTATIGGVDYTAQNYYLHTNNIDCCISKQLSTDLSKGCKSIDPKYAEYKNMLLAIQDAFDCELYVQAQLGIDRLTKLCGCNCGC